MKAVSSFWVRMLGIATFCLPLLAQAGAFDDFFKATKNDNADEIVSLLQRGLDPNLVDEERGDTGLILALREGSMKVFTVLVNAHNIDLEAKSNNGDNALMIAAYTGNLPAVETLLAKGANVKRPGWTALHYAAANGNEQIIRLLLDKGADLEAASPNKTTPIMMAAYFGKIYAVKLLFDAGADALRRNDVGLNAIDFATKFGHEDIAEGLTYRLKKAGKL